MAGAFTAGWFLKPKLGLDLSGGTQIVLETRDAEDGTKANASNTDLVVEVLRNRIDSLGVSEATLSRSGENRIIVELPGVQDPTEAAEVLGQTAQLTIHPVLGVDQSIGTTGGGMFGDFRNAPADNSAEASDSEAQEEESPAEDEEGSEESTESGEEAEAVDPEDIALTLPDESGTLLQLGKPALTGDQVDRAEATLNELQTEWLVNVEFKGAGREAWKKLTGEAACHSPGDPRRRIAIVLDNEIISAPEVDANDVACNVGMSGGRTSITGGFDAEEAKELALLIEGGSLPLPVEEVQRQTVGPTLGAEAIKASFIAGLIGIALTAIYISISYRFAGFLASVALLCYTVIAYAALVALGATLTLPGLAGFVLHRYGDRRQRADLRADPRGVSAAGEGLPGQQVRGHAGRHRKGAGRGGCRRGNPPSPPRDPAEPAQVVHGRFAAGVERGAGHQHHHAHRCGPAVLPRLRYRPGLRCDPGPGHDRVDDLRRSSSPRALRWTDCRFTPLRRLWLIGAAAVVVGLVAVLSDGLRVDNVLPQLRRAGCSRSPWRSFR